MLLENGVAKKHPLRINIRARPATREQSSWDCHPASTGIDRASCLVRADPAGGSARSFGRLPAGFPRTHVRAGRDHQFQMGRAATSDEAECRSTAQCSYAELRYNMTPVATERRAAASFCRW